MIPARAKVLIVCFDNIGDVVFASSLAYSLKQAQPEIVIDIWTKEYCTFVAAQYPGIRHIFGSDPYWDKAPGRSRGSRIRFLKTWWQIRKQSGYDAILVASPHWKSALWARLIPASLRSGFNNRKSRFFLSHAAPWKPSERICKNLGQLLAPCGVHALNFSRLEAFHASSTRQSRILIHGFAGNRRRCLATGHLKTVISVLLKDLPSGYSVALVGTETELNGVRPDLSDLPQLQFVSSKESEKLLHECALFVGHDSGPLHLAHAVGVPVFGIYLPGSSPRTLPCSTAAHEVYSRPSPDHVDTAELAASIVSFFNKITTALASRRVPDVAE